MHWEPDTSRQVDELEGLNELVPLEQDHTRAKLVFSPTVPLLDSVCYSVVIGHDIRRAHGKSRITACVYGPLFRSRGPID